MKLTNMLNREIVLQELKNHINGLTLAELRTAVTPRIDPKNNIDTVLNTAIATLYRNNLIGKVKKDVSWQTKPLFYYVARMTAFEQLMAIQYQMSLKEGEANFGLAGKVAETLDEIQFDFLNVFPNDSKLSVRSFCQKGEVLDRYRKEIKEGKLTVHTSFKDDKQYDKNLADTLHYLLLLMKDKGIEHYASLIVKKLQHKNPTLKL